MFNVHNGKHRIALNPNILIRTFDNAREIKRILSNRIPLNSKNVKNNVAPFFIIGSGRSGNTLLRAMLMKCPKIAIPPESYVLAKIIRKFYRYSYLPWHDLSKMVISEFSMHPQFFTWQLDASSLYEAALKIRKDEQSLAVLIDTIYMCYAKKHQSTANRWGDKTPKNTIRLEYLNWIFPNAQYLHIIRDGRDVVASYLDSGIYNDAGIAASRWLLSVTKAQFFSENLKKENYCEIKYEDLVLSPKKTLGKICSFLKIEFVEEMLSFWETSQNLGDTIHFHHKNVKNPLNSKAIGRWQERLNTEQQKLIGLKLNDKLKDLNYEL